MPDSFLPGTAEAWQGKKVLLIQDNWRNPDDTEYPIQQLTLHGAKVYLLVRPSTSNLHVLQTDPLITGLIMYEGGQNLWSLFRFARTHYFDTAVLYLKDHCWERRVHLIFSFFMWKAHRKLVILQDGKDTFYSISAFKFWIEANGRISPIIITLATRPYISFRNRRRAAHVFLPTIKNTIDINAVAKAMRVC